MEQPQHNNYDNSPQIESVDHNDSPELHNAAADIANVGEFIELLLVKIAEIEDKIADVHSQKGRWLNLLEEMKLKIFSLNDEIKNVEHGYLYMGLGALKSDDPIKYNAYVHKKAVDLPELLRAATLLNRKVKTADEQVATEVDDLQEQKRRLASMVLEQCGDYDKLCEERDRLVAERGIMLTRQSAPESDKLLRSLGYSRAQIELQ